MVDIEPYHTAYITLMQLIESTSALNVTKLGVTSVDLRDVEPTAAQVLPGRAVLVRWVADRRDCISTMTNKPQLLYSSIRNSWWELTGETASPQRRTNPRLVYWSICAFQGGSLSARLCSSVTSVSATYRASIALSIVRSHCRAGDNQMFVRRLASWAWRYGVSYALP